MNNICICIYALSLSTMDFQKNNYTNDNIKAFLIKQYTECMSHHNTNTTYFQNVTLIPYNNNNNNAYNKNNHNNIDADPVYCPLRFDGYLCWPKTLAGRTVIQNCPEFVEGFNKNFLAHKTCHENGSWNVHPETQLEWSNYTSCIDYEDFEFRRKVNQLYIKGYAISLVTLIISLGIFSAFRSLRCTRIRIHVHLFLSLALTCILWILWYQLIIDKPENISNNQGWCITLHLILHYLMLTNYFWMFCEGLHLHLVLVVVFIKDKIVMRWFMIIGWLAPIFFILTYGIARAYYTTDATQCWMEDSDLIWLLTVPVCMSLVASFVFLVNVVRVLVKKLYPSSSQPAPLAIRKAVRATIILVPLFGLQHFLLPFRPDTGTPLERIYQILSAVIVSLQGFCVSCLFCFANHDVLLAVRCFIGRYLPNLFPPMPVSINTGQIGTQSRELGV